jgi:hypothetical protein
MINNLGDYLTFIAVAHLEQARAGQMPPASSPVPVAIGAELELPLKAK